MHTFSPAKMWIGGLKRLRKPFLHLHTQYNRDIPWTTIDMDFMNLNQTAHGDREFGFHAPRVCASTEGGGRLLEGPDVLDADRRLDESGRGGWHDWQGAKFARFGDNMRDVAVTEGDKVAAEMLSGYSVNGYGMGDLVEHVISQLSDADVDTLVQEYDDTYYVAAHLRQGAAQRIVAA